MAALPVRQRRPGRHRGHHGRLSRLLSSGSKSTAPRLGRHGGRGHREVGLRQEASGDDKAISKADGRTQDTGGGAADPAAIGHHGHTRQFQDVLKAIKKGRKPRDRRPRRPPLASRSSWRSTRRPKPAAPSSCRCRAIRCSRPGNSKTRSCRRKRADTPVVAHRVLRNSRFQTPESVSKPVDCIRKS